MAILQGYKYGPINCGVCGTNYIKIESTSNPDVVLMTCWEGHTGDAPRSNAEIQQLIGAAKEASVIPDPATFRESIPRLKVQLIFLVVAILIALLDGRGWGVGTFLFLNFIAIGYKMNPRFFTEA